jgi:hypothetical protein
MSEDDKKVEETTEDENLETNEEGTELEGDQSAEKQESVESEDEQSDDKGVDYKSEYERLQGELAQKNERITKQDKKILKLKQRSNEQDEEQDEDEEESPDISLLVKKQVEEQMSALTEDTIDEEVEKISSNDDEKKLIRWYFDNRIIKTGWSRRDIRDYVSDAKALANKGKLAIASKVIKKQEQSKNSSSTQNFTGTPPNKSSAVSEYDKHMAQKYFKGDVKKWMKYKT